MKKWMILAVVLLLAWFGLKNVALSKYLSSGPALLPPQLSYAEPDHWAAWPEVTPAGAWETPWGIDAFVVLPPPSIAHKHGLIPPDNSKSVEETLQTLVKISDAIPGETPTYAPLYRAPAPSNKGDVARQMRLLAEEDLLKAFKHYLANANQTRGVLLVIVEPAGNYSHTLLDRLQAEDLVDRFAGMVSLVPEGTSLPLQTLECSGALNGECHQQINTKSELELGRILLPSPGGPARISEVYDANGVAEAIKVQAEAVSLWLDENQPKPAEPFGFSQVIEAAPIYRPGEDTPIDEEN